MTRVASYCRVSTDKNDQANSFETQKRYFRQYIETHPDWELYEIYADEGITGTTTKKRTQFNRMMNDAYEGRFRMIITKEVSRFSRNILDTIRYTRELKAIGIGVIFATDRINTLEPEAEMLLSYLASMAQEESRRTSTRVVWGQTRQMERGVVFGRSLLGYDVRGGIMTVDPEGAEIVRLIFHKYALEQVSAAQIAGFLTRQGYRSPGGNDTWQPATVVKILKNEKYVGDLIQKKTYTPDFLTHAKKANRGQVPLVTIQNHHEPIVSRQIWDLARERLLGNSKQAKHDGSHTGRYVFSGRIRCAECGSSFVGRFKYLKNGTKLRRWSCGTATRFGAAACGVGKLVRDDDAMQMLRTAIRSLPMDADAIVSSVTALTLEAIRSGGTDGSDDPGRLEREIRRIRQKKETVMDSYFSGDITKADLQAMKSRYEAQEEAMRLRLKEAQLRQTKCRNAESLSDAIRAELSGILSGKIESDVFCRAMVKSLTVFKDRHMELRLQFLPQVFRFRDEEALPEGKSFPIE